MKGLTSSVPSRGLTGPDPGVTLEDIPGISHQKEASRKIDSERKSGLALGLRAKGKADLGSRKFRRLKVRGPVTGSLFSGGGSPKDLL